MRQRVTVSCEDGEPTGERPLRDAEIVAMVRNWTGSDLVATCRSAPLFPAGDSHAYGEGILPPSKGPA